MLDFLTQQIRPVWIASYPRSGNTFLRIILEKIFQIPTFSIYRVEGQTFRDPSAEALEDAPFLPRKWQRQLSDSPDVRLTLIKTHDWPGDERPAIYIVREGRAAIDSYFHYHKKFAFEQPSLTDVIAGGCQFGSWSEHYRRWQPDRRANTLLLKYEELVSNPDAAIPKLADFLKIKPTEGRLPTFEELNQKFPAFFRRGQSKDFLKEWSPGQLSLYGQIHGQVARQLGYPADAPEEIPASVAADLATSVARLHKLYIQELHNEGNSLAAQQELSTEVNELSKQVKQKEQVLHPLIENAWVKVGMALRLVPRARSRPEHQ